MLALHDIAEPFPVGDDARIVPTYMQNAGTLPVAETGMTARASGSMPFAGLHIQKAVTLSPCCTRLHHTGVFY